MVSITLRAPTLYLSLNDREHWAPRARKVRAWRSAAAIEASRYSPAITSWPADVFVRLDVPDKRRRDPANYAPVVKCLVDGLTDAGWWPDDTPEYVHTHEPELRPVGRRTGLTVTITIKERT